jgi:hypothetical protein
VFDYNSTAGPETRQHFLRASKQSINHQNSGIIEDCDKSGRGRTQRFEDWSLILFLSQRNYHQPVHVIYSIALNLTLLPKSADFSRPISFVFGISAYPPLHDTILFSAIPSSSTRSPPLFRSPTPARFLSKTPGVHNDQSIIFSTSCSSPTAFQA